MTSIPGFWDICPHEPVPVEATWDEFVQTVGGKRIAEIIPKSPNFDNADYLFESLGVVAELKEVQTEFGRAPAFRNGYDILMKRLVAENPDWKPELFGGNGEYPKWFYPEYLRLFRPPISRVLKKANRQIRETKEYLGKTSTTGVLLFVNDGFTTLGPDLVQALARDLLTSSYSSIDCFVYLTVNRYVGIKGSDVPRLVWAPTYRKMGVDSLQQFVDDLGRRWFRFLDGKIGPFTTDDWETKDHEVIRGSKAIVLPGEHRG